jgi:murein DD-endopeptidase MepM/ murein hydrolase activator NlpD
MIADMLRWSGVAPSNKQFVLRLADRASHAVRHRRPALAASLAAGAAAIALAYFGVGFAHYSARLADEQAAAIRVETANAALQDELGRMRDRLGAIEGRLAALSDDAEARQRHDAERKPVAAEAAPSSKADRIAQLTKAADLVQRELRLTPAQRTVLLALLGRIDLGQPQARAALDPAQASLQQLQAERDKAVAERDALRAQLNQLQQPPQKSSAVAAPAAGPEQPAVVAAAAPPAEPRPAAAPAAAAIPRGIRVPLGQIEHVLSSAGIDVARLFSQFGVSRGEGGPFVPAARGQPAAAILPPDKIAALRAMMKALPVAAPLSSFEIGSPFGEREDPINGRESFHSGLDLDAPYMSPVYATAPGVVTFAGYHGEYGKLVEIDHGHGISTRYAHLHRYTVSVGQHVAAHAQIGLLGTTGRSTGPHVHYEVLVNGEPQDPAKFLSLGNIVPAAAKQR